MKLANITEETKDDVIKEYLKWYTIDRYQNLCRFLELINKLPQNLK